MSIVHYVLAMGLQYHPPNKKSPTRKLRVATQKLDKAFVQQLMSSGADYKASDRNGDSVLHLAFKRLYNRSTNLQLRLIRLLEVYLDSGVAVNRKNASGETVLYLAIKHRLEHVVKFLMRRGARFDSPDVHGNTTLHFIVEHEFERFARACAPPANESPFEQRVVAPDDSFVRWALSKATKVDCKNFAGYTPLALAAKYNLLHIVLALLEYTQDASLFNKKRKTVFHIFLESIARFDSYDRLAEGIPTFCYDKKYVAEILQLLLGRGFSIDAADAKGNTPILVALKNDQTDIARTMLEYPIELFDKEIYKIEFTDDFSLVQLAVVNKNTRLLQYLKESGADFGLLHRGNNLLHLLSMSSVKLPENAIYEVIVDLLIDEGCQVNARNDESMTPLHLASQAGIFPVVKRLIEYGANVHSRELGHRRFTPLHEAVDNNRDDVIEVLVNAGADVNARTANGQTPLHLAMLYSSNMVKTLLRLGGHVDVQDDDGRAPFHDAICYHNVYALRELLKFGVDISEPGTIREMKNLTDTSSVVSVILQHWIKLQAAAGLPADHFYGRQLVDRSFKICYKECDDEAQRLKDCLFNDGTSMYELLRMNPNRRCKYMVKRDMKDSLLSPKLENLFPKYHVIIQACYHEATARYSLLEPAKCAWYELTDINLPEPCVDKIISYLNNMTLRTMAGSLKDASLKDGCYDS